MVLDEPSALGRAHEQILSTSNIRCSKNATHYKRSEIERRDVLSEGTPILEQLLDRTDLPILAEPVVFELYVTGRLTGSEIYPSLESTN
jgi:hypothetical protein